MSRRRQLRSTLGVLFGLSALAGGCMSGERYELSITSVVEFGFGNGCIRYNIAAEGDSLYHAAAAAGIDDAWFEEIALYGPHVGAGETAVLAADLPFELWGVDSPSGRDQGEELLFEGVIPAGSGIAASRPSHVEELVGSPAASAEASELSSELAGDSLARDDLVLCLEVVEAAWTPAPPVGVNDVPATFAAEVTVTYAGAGHLLGGG